MTESAKNVVREIVTADDAPEGSGLRIAAEPDEDGEVSLSLSVEAAPAEGDEVVEDEGARVFLEHEAASLLGDKLLDAQAHGDHIHFTVEPQRDATD